MRAHLVLLAGCWIVGGLWPTSSVGQLLSIPQRNQAVAASPELERVELLDGRVYHGLIESLDDLWINLIEIQKPRGKPSFLVIRPIDRALVKRLRRLDPERANRLREQIDRLRNRSKIESGMMKAVRLETTELENTLRYCYRGRWFSLDSTASEETTRWIVVRTEQIFTAYRQVLPRRTFPRRPLRLTIFGSIGEYQAHIQKLGLAIDNRALFSKVQNQILIGSELSRVATEMGQISAQHERLLEEIERLEKDVRQRSTAIKKLLDRQGASRDQVLDVLVHARRKIERQIKQRKTEIKRAEQKNARILAQAGAHILAQLYHEAFHAYLYNYVYPDEHYDVPVWLDEGLATLFEKSLVESGSLRLDIPNRTALDRIQADLRASRSLPLTDILSTDVRSFLIGSDNHASEAGRYYAHAWGIVYFLTFDFNKGLLNTESLDRYVSRESSELKPAARFERLTGLTLNEFEHRWKRYLLTLK